MANGKSCCLNLLPRIILVMMQSTTILSSTAPASVIEVRDLTKRYGSVVAVDSISFEVKSGQAVALLGGNGAGKTTTLSILLGLLLPSAGTVRVLGEDMVHQRHRVLSRLNFSSPYVDLPHRLSVRENMIVYAHLYGIPDVHDRIIDLVRELDIADLLDRPCGKLSAGQKTRVSLAKSLLNRPELLLLDEPTASLDPDTGDWVRSYLESYGRAATLLLASHNMAEVERLCDFVLIMRQGRICDRGTPADLIRRYGRGTLEEVFLDIARNRHAIKSKICTESRTCKKAALSQRFHPLSLPLTETDQASWQKKPSRI